jgi:hypothetical protein
MMAQRDQWTRVEVFLARLKFVIFEIAMLLCFLMALYKIMVREFKP